MTCPVAEPFDAFPCRMFRAQHMGRHRQAHKLMPPAQFPNQLDVSAVRQTSVVQVKSEFIRLQVEKARLDDLDPRRAELEGLEAPRTGLLSSDEPPDGYCYRPW